MHFVCAHLKRPKTGNHKLNNSLLILSRCLHVFYKMLHQITWTGRMSHSIVKQILVAGKIVITVKLIAPVAQIFDSGQVTVVAFTVKTLLKAQTTQSLPLPFIQYLFQSFTHMVIVPSHLHPNDFTLPLYPSSDPSIKLSAARALSLCLCVGVSDFCVSMSVGFLWRLLSGTKVWDFNSLCLISYRQATCMETHAKLKNIYRS